MKAKASLGCVALLGVLGCSGPDAAPAPDDVSKIQERLETFGYFPNDDLAREFPAWRPIVNETPTPGQLDDATVRAVQAFQTLYRLPVTGSVDPATRELLFAARCDEPDGIAPAEESSKFDLKDSRAAIGATITWRVDNDGPGVSKLQVEQAATSALTNWQRLSSLSFRKANPGETPNIRIVFALGKSTSVGHCYALDFDDYCAGNGIAIVRLNNLYAWSVTDPPLPSHYDVGQVLIHELGHAIGLRHSSKPPAAMYGFPTDRFPHLDDMVALSSRYDEWESFDSCVKDIDGKPIPNQPAASNWAIECGTGDRPVWQLSQGFWRQDFGAASTRIAVDHAGRPWTVDANGAIHFKSSSESSFGTWTRVPGCAKDIGADGTIWIVGCRPSGNDFIVERFNGTSFTPDPLQGAGVRITVDPAGRPWVTTANGSIWRRSSESLDPGTGASWQQLPGGAAADIGTNTLDYPWIVNAAAPLVWNEQFQIDVGSPLPREQHQWIMNQGLSLALQSPLIGVAGLSDGSAWVVAANGSVWRSKR